MVDDIKPKLIFINCVPMTFIFAEKVNLAFYERNGFAVELWDLANLYFSGAQLSAYFSGSSALQYKYENTTCFSNRREVGKALRALPEGAMVFHLSRHFQPCLDDFWLLRQFKKCNIPYVIQRIENPFSAALDNKKPRSAWRSIANRILPLNQLVTKLKKVFNYLEILAKQALFAKTNFYLLPSAAFGVGNVGRRDCRYLIDRGVEFVSIPSPAVDWATVHGMPTESSLILFVDESIGFAPDAKLNGFETTTDLPKYYANLKQIFDLVEKALNAKVVIGASGKIDYSTNPFDRPIYYKETLALTAKAKLVLGHSSGALYNAFCLDKPILLIQDETFSAEKSEHVVTLSNGLAIPYYINIDIDENLIKNLNSLSHQHLVHQMFCENGVQGHHTKIILTELKRLSVRK